MSEIRDAIAILRSAGHTREADAVSALCDEVNGLREQEPVITDAMVSAALCSQARDDEGEFPIMLDLLDFSGENRSRTAMRHALECALLYAPETRRPAAKESLTTADPTAVPDGYTLVKTDTVLWLLGENGDFECPPAQYFRGNPAPYFWRRRLRADALLAAAQKERCE